MIIGFSKGNIIFSYSNSEITKSANAFGERVNAQFEKNNDILR